MEAFEEAEHIGLEKKLRAYMYAKVPNDQNTKRAVQRAFTDFDLDGSGAVSIGEFIKALERFGMHVAGQRPGVGGLPMDVVQSLFDKYVSMSMAMATYMSMSMAMATYMPFANGCGADALR